MNREKVAEELFNDREFNCAQSVFLAFSRDFGFDDETALKLTSPFGGGIARLENLCGAVLGGIMAIGLFSGHFKPDQGGRREKTYYLTREFIRRFAEMNGSIICRDLVGCDFNADEGKKYMKDNDIRTKVCLKCVRDSVRIAASFELDDRS